MNSKVFKSLTICFLLLFSLSASAVVMVKPVNVDTLSSVSAQGLTTAPPVFEKKSSSKKQWKVKKKVKRLLKRLKKKNNSFGNVLESRRFRLGVLLLLIGIIAGLFTQFIALGQLIGWLAGVTALIGLIFIIWALIEHSGIL